MVHHNIHGYHTYSMGHQLVDVFIIVVELVQSITTLATGRTNQSTKIYNTKSTGKITHINNLSSQLETIYNYIYSTYNMKIFH